MKKHYLLAAAFMAFSFVIASDASAQAQKVKPPKYTYKNAIGVKFTPFAVTFKTFLGQRNRAFEALLDFDNGFRATVLYEFHGDLTASRNLKWYVGFGGHGGYYEVGPVDGISAGVDGVVGLDYKFARLPLNIAIDWQPSLELVTPETAFQGGRGGIALRLAF